MLKLCMYILWAIFYLICSIFGLLPEWGIPTAVFVTLAVLFFLPPGVLLGQAVKNKDRRELLRLRVISALSLGMTLLLFLLNIAAVGASDDAGDVLFFLLNFVSVPMMCGQFYPLGMFLWACLLVASFPKIWIKKA